MRSTIALVALLTLAAAGCTRAHAKVSPDNPPLDVPLPPEHDVEPTETDTPAPVPLPQEPARTAPPRRNAPSPREQPRTDPQRPPQPAQPEAAPAPSAELPKPEEAPRAAAPLQTMPTTAEGEAERTIRATLARANTDLNRVDYRALNSDARNQYDTAKRIIRQADEAIRAKNLVFAKTLADKAASLAVQLAGR